MRISVRKNGILWIIIMGIFFGLIGCTNSRVETDHGRGQFNQMNSLEDSTSGAIVTVEPPQKTESFLEYKADRIENINEINNTQEDWWVGNQTDENNRPLHPLDYENKYKIYGADFIKNADKKEIYLTFDEGYENGYSNRILDVLKEKNCHAVFFVTMDFVKNNDKLVSRIINEGHILANHSVTHPAKGISSLSQNEQENEIMELHTYVKDKYSYTMNLFRYPAGKFSLRSLAIINNLNYRSVFWSFAYLDYDTKNQPDQKEALDLMVSKLHPGAIYLLHAVSETNTNVLGDFIDCAVQNGYTVGDYK